MYEYLVIPIILISLCIIKKCINNREKDEVVFYTYNNDYQKDYLLS